MTKPKPKTARDALLALKGKGTWGELAIKLDKGSGVKFERGYLYQVAHDTRRASNRLLKALGLPLNAVPVMPCAKCGEVHEQKKMCPTRRAPRPRTWRHLYELTDQQVAHLLRTRKDYP